MGRGHLSKPRIVLVTPYYRPVVGGLTTFVAGLSTELIRRGAEVTVLTRDGAEVPGVRRGPSSPATFVRWCRRTIREIRPDVVHCHGHWYCLAGALSPSGRPLANRVVFTVHTLPDVRFAFRLPFRWLLRRAHVITFVSEHSRTEFVQRFGARGESAIIAPGVRDSFVEAKEGPRTRPNEFRICAVSLMSWVGKVRGMRLLMEATAKLARVLPGVSLTLVGDGEFRSDLEALGRQLGLGARVRFTGLVDDPAPILADSDVFCHISFRDSFAQAVLEAMIMAVPVIVNEGTLEDPILRGPDSGVIRCHPNAEEVFRALRRLASNPAERVRLGGLARELVLREYSWLNQAGRFWTVYGLSSDPVSS